MLGKSVTKIMLAAALMAATTTLSPAFAAKRHMRLTKTAGACAQPVGRCLSDCDQFNWCQVNVCTNGKSTPVPFWRCFEPSGLCFAPRC